MKAVVESNRCSNKPWHF